MNAIPKRKIRKSTKNTFIIVAVLLFIVSSIFLYNGLFFIEQYSNMKEIYKYETNFKADYSVNLKDNIFIEEKTLPSGKAYLSDLIDTINFDLMYNFKADTKSKLKYTYDIKGIVKGVYIKDGKEQEVWNRVYTLTETKSEEVETNEIKIKENVLLNYNEYNQQALLLAETYAIRLTTKMYLQLDLKIETIQDGEKVNVEYKSDIIFDLGAKTTEMTGKFKDEGQGNMIVEVVSKEHGNAIQTALGVIALVAAAYLVNKALIGTTINHNIKSVYKSELNKILRVCQDKIVHLNNKIDVSNQELIDVKDFQEIIKLSEELGKPILCWSSKEEEETWFTIVSNEVLYRFILRDEK